MYRFHFITHAKRGVTRVGETRSRKPYFGVDIYSSPETDKQGIQRGTSVGYLCPLTCTMSYKPSEGRPLATTNRERARRQARASQRGGRLLFTLLSRSIEVGLDWAVDRLHQSWALGQLRCKERVQGLNPGVSAGQQITTSGSSTPAGSNHPARSIPTDRHDA